MIIYSVSGTNRSLGLILSHAYLPDEMREGVSPIEDLLVRIHPSVSNADLVPLSQLLVREAVWQVVVV